MDGNGRWARERHLPVGAGHRAGAKALKRVVRAAGDAGVKDLTVFSFSTENWSRPDREVGDLMGLFCELIDREVPELDEESVQMRFIGRIDELDARAARHGSSAAEDQTAAQHGPAPVRGDELRRPRRDRRRRPAVRGRVRAPRPARPSSPSTSTRPDLRDPELVIRTSGEQRLSNFLLWQSAYAELHFSAALWPDFSPEDLDVATRGVRAAPPPLRWPVTASPRRPDEPACQSPIPGDRSSRSPSWSIGGSLFAAVLASSPSLGLYEFYNLAGGHAAAAVGGLPGRSLARSALAWALNDPEHGIAAGRWALSLVLAAVAGLILPRREDITMRVAHHPARRRLPGRCRWRCW